METRATKYQFEALKLVSHLVAELIDDGAHLKALEAAAGCEGETERMTQQAKEWLARLTSTLPLNQRKQLLRHVSDMKIAFTSPVAISRDEAYVYIPRRLVLSLIKTSATKKCAICIATPNDIRDCALRRDVNELRMDDQPDDVLGCTVRLLAGNSK